MPTMKLAPILILTFFWMNGTTSNEMWWRKKPKSERVTDLCDLRLSDGKNIRCFCVAGVFPVSNAECWIFGPNGDENFMWNLLKSSQPYLLDFSFMANNQTKSVPSAILSEMFHLTNLSISLASIEHLEKFAFGNSSTIEHLTLSENQIIYLEKFSVSHLPRLKFIDLQKNRIRTIKRFVFHNVTNLTSVLLNDNEIYKIENEAFADLVNVLYIDLSNNYICDINSSTFSGLAKVKVVDLRANRIISLPTLVFSEMWDVEELFLNNNSIKFIANRSFDGMRFLKTLNLANNKITGLPNGLLTGTFTLVNLDLSNNHLETVLFDSINRFYYNLIHNGRIKLLDISEVGMYRDVQAAEEYLATV